MNELERREKKKSKAIQIASIVGFYTPLQTMQTFIFFPANRRIKKSDWSALLLGFLRLTHSLFLFLLLSLFSNSFLNFRKRYHPFLQLHLTGIPDLPAEWASKLPLHYRRVLPHFWTLISTSWRCNALFWSIFLMFVSLLSSAFKNTPLTSVRCDLQFHESHPAYEIAPRGLQMDSAADG